MKEGWEYKKLGEVGMVITGNTPSTKDAENYSSHDYCFVKPSDISKEGTSVLTKTEFYISAKAYNNSRKLPKGSVLTTCIGIIGKVGVLNVEATCNQQINAIIPSPAIITSSFLAYSILSKKSFSFEIIRHFNINSFFRAFNFFLYCLFMYNFISFSFGEIFPACFG